MMSAYELTGKWFTLPEEERTPPHILGLNRLAEKDKSELTPAERDELHVGLAGAKHLNNASGPFGGDTRGGQGGLNNGSHGHPQQSPQQSPQRHPVQQAQPPLPQQQQQQFNSFGAAVAGGMGASGSYQPQVVQVNDPTQFPTLQESTQMVSDKRYYWTTDSGDRIKWAKPRFSG